jgi:hypothetical protein
MSGSKKRKRNYDEGEEIANEIQRELDRSASDAAWGGSVATAAEPELNLDFRSYRLPANRAAKIAIQTIGQVHGCHTCLTVLANDNDQPWVGDHCPPTELDATSRELLGIDDDNTYLFPQCHNCSQQQAGLVREFSTCRYRSEKQSKVDELSAHGRNLLTGTKAPRAKGSTRWNCLLATGPTVKTFEGYDIQHLGSRPGPRGGCHTCGARVPVTEYIADHWVPAAFVTTGMQQLFRLLEIDYPDLQLRPQCTRCSTSQGGQVRQVVDRAIAYGTRQGIVFTERQ